MIFRQLAHLPIIFKVDEGILTSIPSILSNNNLAFKKVLVLSGASFSKKCAEAIIQSSGTENWIEEVIQENTFSEVNRVKERVEKEKITLIIAVGGGKVLDTAKRISLLTNVNHLSIPTIISNDGLISPISVLKNDETGKTESLPAVMPMGVIIDLDLIKQSPIKYIRAAAGDILSNLSSTNDWIIANKKVNEPINDIAFQLSKGSANALVYSKNTDFTYKPFIRQIVQGQVNSGIAMSLAGTSRPCSGSEHLISHAIDYMGLSNKTLHGTQVATASLFCLFLQKKLKLEHLEYAKATQIPLDLFDLSDLIETNLKELFYNSKYMRPGRYTILNEYSEEEFLLEYKKYQEFVKSNS